MKRDEYLELLRDAEVASVRRWFEAGQRVLEIGGGSGHQASILASWGCAVRSIDVAPDLTALRFPVELYDGVHIPADDAAFDRVFSSNVLEHVRDIPALMKEITRVLRPGGLAIHLMPSSAWRGWNMVAHYGYLAQWMVGVARPIQGADKQPELGEFVKRKGMLWAVRRAIAVGAHGEFSSPVTELYHYRRRVWSSVFRENSFGVLESHPGGLFYTGYGLLGVRLKRPAREKLAPWLGSGCNVFVTRPTLRA